ncbi:hypothetical protein AWZ03_003014 [Drosophila navojoa]|uniref:Isochorismatase domain-containing protein 1 n=1 Tax=Drosophila navojoa TaxID=7232 RepID=A0A484BRE4_DRONA|nr:hypothetical protein AWZ03_003014 [Drosophila navojoa]
MVNRMRQSLYRLKSNKTLFMMCDIQEKFKPAIPLIEAVIENSKKLTHVCVEQTAFDLINNGIDVWLVADCCASRLNQDRDLALERLRQIGCIISSTESVIFNLLSDKNHKSFKEIASLVKRVAADLKLGLPTASAKDKK